MELPAFCTLWIGEYQKHQDCRAQSPATLWRQTSREVFDNPRARNRLLKVSEFEFGPTFQRSMPRKMHFLFGFHCQPLYLVVIRVHGNTSYTQTGERNCCSLKWVCLHHTSYSVFVHFEPTIRWKRSTAQIDCEPIQVVAVSFWYQLRTILSGIVVILQPQVGLHSAVRPEVVSSHRKYDVTPVVPNINDVTTQLRENDPSWDWRWWLG